MVTITDAALRQNVFETVYDQINTDKSGYGASTEPELYAVYPTKEGFSFPLIVVGRASPEKEAGSATIGSNPSFRKNITLTIEVYTKKNKDVDIIMDGIDASIESITQEGITLVSNTEADIDIFPNDNKIHAKSMTLEFVRRS